MYIPICRVFRGPISKGCGLHWGRHMGFLESQGTSRWAFVKPKVVPVLMLTQY